MSKKHLSLKPKAARVKYPEIAEAWWYEENGGIDIHIDPRQANRHISLFIPWASIRAALKRKDK